MLEMTTVFVTHTLKVLNIQAGCLNRHKTYNRKGKIGKILMRFGPHVSMFAPQR